MLDSGKLKIKTIGIYELTNNNNINNLDITINIKPWCYGDNTTINNNGYIIFIEDSQGYKLYSEVGGFDIEKLRSHFNSINNLSIDDQYYLFNLLDDIIQKL